MSTLDKKIENYIFGNIPTSELLDKAYDIKVQNFGKTITYSPKVFIPLTTLCQDACAYCTFVKTPKDEVHILHLKKLMLSQMWGINQDVLKLSLHWGINQKLNGLLQKRS